MSQNPKIILKHKNKHYCKYTAAISVNSSQIIISAFHLPQKCEDTFFLSQHVLQTMNKCLQIKSTSSVYN